MSRTSQPWLSYVTLNCYHCCSVAKSCLTLFSPMDCSMPGFPVLHYLSEVAQTHVHWVSDAIQPSHPLSPPFPLALSLSQHQGLFQWVSSGISPSDEYSGLISFRIDWFDFLAVQGTLKSLLQHHSSKASILWHSAFFMVQIIPTCDYWKNLSFDYMDLCSKVMFLFFSMLSRFVIVFLPKSKQLLISWLLTLREVDYLGWTWSNPVSP